MSSVFLGDYRPLWLTRWEDLQVLHLPWVARCLGGINRYGNQTPVPWTVARHSVLVESLMPPTATARQRLLCLGHDIHEIWTGDLCRPAYEACGSELKKLQARIDEKIFSLLGLPFVPDDYEWMAKYDDEAIRVEFELLDVHYIEAQQNSHGKINRNWFSADDDQMWLSAWNKAWSDFMAERRRTAEQLGW